MGRFHLTDEAKADLRAIKDYIAIDSIPQARKVLRDIRATMTSLAETPGIGHKREDITSENVKFKAIYSYLIVYRPDTRPLEIIAVLHGKRDVPPLLEDRT